MSTYLNFDHMQARAIYPIDFQDTPDDVLPPMTSPLLISHVFNLKLYSAEDQKHAEDCHVLGTGLMLQALD